MQEQTINLCYLAGFNTQVDFVIRDGKKVLGISVGSMHKTTELNCFQTSQTYHRKFVGK